MSRQISASATKSVVKKAVEDENYILAIRAMHAYLYRFDENSREFTRELLRMHTEDIASVLEEEDFLLAAELVRDIWKS